MEHVKDGKAELRIVEVPSERPGDQMATLTKDPGMRKVVINTAPMLPSQQALAEGKDGEEDTSATATAPTGSCRLHRRRGLWLMLRFIMGRVLGARACSW